MFRFKTQEQIASEVIAERKREDRMRKAREREIRFQERQANIEFVASLLFVVFCILCFVVFCVSRVPQ